jgi:creatinine amidohydrolase/Fe(II)-dependent formamide hydrolase-like protein
VYFHSGFRQEHLVPVLTDLFERLKATGFRVIIGVTGHNVEAQVTMIDAGLEPVVADGATAGTAVWEVTLSRGEGSDTDHAAKWETSNMLYLYPDLVDVALMGDRPLDEQERSRLGVWGHDPRVHASADVGERNVELAAAAIGTKARELLDSLPEGERSFSLDSLTPTNWWMV